MAEKETKSLKESVHTISLGKAFDKPRKKRGKAAINIIRDYIYKHTRKRPEISEALNEKIWGGGYNPPRKVKVKIVEEEEKAVADLA